MPTYDYECPKGHRFEVSQKMTAKPVATCPKCKARARRVISGGAGFLFKGEGFYITDYRSEDYKKKASADAGAASDKSEKPTKSTADSKSESKPKSESKSASKSKSTKTASDA
jgi:putative FmdB family regulatory protein